MDRSQYAAIIEKRLIEEHEGMRSEFQEHVGQSRNSEHTMMIKKSLRETKYVATQMNKYSSALEEIVYAFQDPRVLKVIEEITGIQGMVPDVFMLRNQFYGQG